jgi:secreted trypsin-like serine protease
MSRTWQAGALVLVASIGCGPGALDGERTATLSSPIEDGVTDTTHTFVVGIVRYAAAGSIALCSGVLLAPNLVATARHCVTDQAPDQVDCATSTFGSVAAANRMVVSTDASLRSGANPRGVATILVPTGADQTKICGNDIALLILDANIDLPAYVVPAVSPPMTQHQTYSTSVTAIGYGVTTPTDTRGITAGTRRVKEHIPLYCVPNDRTIPDCFIDPAAPMVMTTGEFISGDASACGGDSGSSVFDQAEFDAGRWVSFGVLSRGALSADMQTCIQPIYTRFDAWGDLLTTAAKQAAAMGHYGVPPWANVAPGSDAGAQPDGGPCGAKACPPENGATPWASDSGGCALAPAATDRPGRAGLLLILAVLFSGCLGRLRSRSDVAARGGSCRDPDRGGRARS